jgi:hypothetical protein
MLTSTNIHTTETTSIRIHEKKKKYPTWIELDESPGLTKEYSDNMLHRLLRRFRH